MPGVSTSGSIGTISLPAVSTACGFNFRAELSERLDAKVQGWLPTEQAPPRVRNSLRIDGWRADGVELAPNWKRRVDAAPQSLYTHATMSDARKHHLITICFSHFNEKARWALDRFGVAYRESGYLPLLHMPFALWASRFSNPPSAWFS